MKTAQKGVKAPREESRSRKRVATVETRRSPGGTREIFRNIEKSNERKTNERQTNERKK